MTTAKLGKQLKMVDPKGIVIPPDRQRSGGKDIDTTDIEPSIRARGILHPLIIKKETNELVAGERRLRAALRLALKEVPIRYYEDLDQIEAKIVELEENERRQGLDWKDHTKAIAKLHELYGLAANAAGDQSTWGTARTAEMLAYNQNHIAKCLRIAKDISNPKIANAPGLNAAYNILVRLDERRIADAMNEINDATPAARAAQAPAQAPPITVISLKDLEEGEVPSAEPIPRIPASASIVPVEDSIFQIGFADWAEQYNGRRFNLVHCDFPFGTNVFGGEAMGGWKDGEEYDDDPDVYWKLIRDFCAARDKFLAPSAHIMFWYDIDYHHDTLALFEELAPELIFNPKPLIWVKSDNVGILADPKRGPRHIYETCLIASRGDRLIAHATSDAYSCPTDKTLHPSCKPEAMLRFFMRMFVDEYTELLDPTCGSGAALRAAESLGAQRTIGLEIAEDFVDGARTALRTARLKAAAAKALRKEPA